MKHSNANREARNVFALALIALLGALVVSRLLIALKVVLGIPLLVITLWALMIPLKLFALFKARAWWNRRARQRGARSVAW